MPDKMWEGLPSRNLCTNTSIKPTFLLQTHTILQTSGLEVAELSLFSSYHVSYPE